MSCEPCMCGDTHCGVCGPLQGNERCYACGLWSMDGGCVDPKVCEANLKLLEEEEERRRAALIAKYGPDPDED